MFVYSFKFLSSSDDVIILEVPLVFGENWINFGCPLLLVALDFISELLVGIDEFDYYE